MCDNVGVASKVAQYDNLLRDNFFQSNSIFGKLQTVILFKAYKIVYKTVNSKQLQFYIKLTICGLLNS